MVLNTIAHGDRSIVERAVTKFGSQSVFASIDVKGIGEAGRVFTGGSSTDTDAVAHARAMETAGAGEILLTSVDREGTFEGFDLDLVRRVAEAVSIPVVANGGAGALSHVKAAVHAGVSAVATGSMVVYQVRTARCSCATRSGMSCAQRLRDRDMSGV